MRVIYTFLLALVLAFLCVTAVLAAGDTTVTFDWGVFLGQLGGELVPWLASLLLLVLIAILPAPVRAFLTTQRTQQVEQLLERGLGYGVSELQKVAVQTGPLTIDVRNELVKAAVQYALDHGSKALLDFIGGAVPLQQKLVARLPTSPAVLSLVAPTQVGATTQLKTS